MDLHIAASLASLLGWAVHGGILTRRLSSARRDPLTGLHTRAGWTARAEHCIRRHPRAAVILVDLDHVDRTTAGQVGVSEVAVGWRPVRDIQPIGIPQIRNRKGTS
ncbi:hypothetical protein [Streptomyces sp. CA-106110]|uniref:hypothetical protein n=1 Tax=Streptomyces sp. CA-106110 TaxID=3240044 RepID=UPI003D8D7F24